MRIYDMQKEINEVNIANGWRDNPEHPDPTFRECLALIATEVTEAIDAWRRWGFADATKASEPGSVGALDDVYYPPKPEGVGSEFADIIIRTLDDVNIFGLVFREEEFEEFEVPLDPAISFLECMFLLLKDLGRVDDAWENGIEAVGPRLNGFYRATLYYAGLFGIRLEDEYHRKLAYNRTRVRVEGIRHGGKRM